jgi:hypothetical protein
MPSPYYKEVFKHYNSEDLQSSNSLFNLTKVRIEKIIFTFLRSFINKHKKRYDP